MTAARPALTGGCQCGRVRFALTKPAERVSICHCRMCQKATGAPFASFAQVDLADFKWTRGEPSAFQSSSIAMRDFCAACGTPLSYRKIGGDKIELTTGSFDRPDHVVPTLQFGTESKLGWVNAVAALPGKTTASNFGPEKMKQVFSHQHPDHD